MDRSVQRINWEIHNSATKWREGAASIAKEEKRKNKNPTRQVEKSLYTKVQTALKYCG